MKVSLATALAFVASSIASPVFGGHGAPCIVPQVRKEWRTLTSLEKLSFIVSVKCLHSKPAKLKDLYADTKTRFEDFATVHKYSTPYIHFTGIFLPWHRLMIAEYERALKTECGYIGALPYWDYTLDNAAGHNFTSSPIFDPVLGFGGNGKYEPALSFPEFGVWGGGCVRDGPFKNWAFSVGPQNTYDVQEPKRCLKRNFWQDYYGFWAWQDKEDPVLAAATWEEMWLLLEGTPGVWDALHSAGHFLVGGPFWQDGTGADPWTSNLEPLFYLHHSNIDRVWWEWQQKSTANKWAIGGNMKPYVENAFGDDAQWNYVNASTTLASDLSFGSQYAQYAYFNNAKVGHVLSTKGETAPGGYKSPLCYIYAPSPKHLAPTPVPPPPAEETPAAE